MKGHNFTFPKSISLASILVLSLISVGFLLPQVIAEHGVDPGITTHLDVGSNIVSFRDSTNILLQSSTLSVDTSSIKAGFFTIIVEEEDSNLDSTAIDVILSSATSTSSELEDPPGLATIEMSETGPDTGVFSGTINIINHGPSEGNNLQLQRGNDISVIYQEEHVVMGQIVTLGEPLAVGRLSAEITTAAAGDGNIKITDALLSDAEIAAVNTNFRPVTHPVKIELLGSTTLDQTAPPVITISYANAALQSLDDPVKLNIYYKPNNPTLCDGCFGWTKVRDFTAADPSSHDSVGKTITSDVANTQFGLNGRTIFGPNFGIQTTEAEFMLGFEKGIEGGGGGGLVRQGLVVNALVGVSSLSALFGGGTGDGPTNPTFGEGSMSVLGSGEQGFGGIISGGDENHFDTITVVEVGEKVTVRVPLYENQGINNIDEVIWYLNFAGENYDRLSIDTYILFDRGVVTVVDPHEKLESANIEIFQEDGWNLIVKGELVFKNTMTPSNFLFYSLDLDRNFGQILIPNALEVIEPSILLPDTIKKFVKTNPSITQTELEEIPLWVKSNALWWKQKQIDDSDFMAGIQYLIQKTIIEIDENELSNSITSKELPVWLRDVAGMWADDSITDDEFVDAMQWLINNGILEVKQ